MSLTTTFLTDLPGCDAQVIVPSDSDNQGPFRSLYVGATGDITLVTLGGNAVQFKNVPVGMLYVACTRVNNTGTSATLMVGLT